VHGVETLRT